MEPTQAEPPAKDAGVKTSSLLFQKRKQLQENLEHVQEEMYKKNLELVQTNKMLSLLRNIDALVLESHATLKEVCEHITEAITQATDYPLVALFARSSQVKEEITLYGWSGKDLLGGQLQLSISQPIHLKLTNSWLEQPESSRLLPLEGLTTEAMADWLHYRESEVAEALKQVPLQSVYAVKLHVRRRLVGLLVVGFNSSAAEVTGTDTLFVDRLSEAIGVAMDNKLLFEENQHVLRQLKDSNAKLRHLDEAKDDFISMASHQLRTPLTSIKGYVSMVLEGDAGKISPQQKKLLTQSFFSSQRMVYIIADLLNVSRLRTGKFAIEGTPISLADVVSEEIVQLAEIAKSRSLELVYDKPKNFPILMIDETKTRQVIMNFVDNAIYYTPSGGKIEVKLIDKPTTVELRVEDNGIGVPKSEQPHLFTKFYRAGNARKRRPDGTGLGLFMAKKVIVGQGGAVIFESEEGKGSTFGFIFSKAKLAVPPAAEPAPTAAKKK